MRRRTVIATFGAGLLAGCAGLDGSGTGARTITPVEPDDDGTATLGELRYLLSDNEVDRYENLDVRRLVRRGDTVELTYASTAADVNEFVGEMGTVAALYAVYVGNGGTTDRLTVTVEPSYEGQPTSFAVETDWVRAYNNDTMSGQALVNRVLRTAEGGGNESA